MRLFVTGGSGLLGHALLPELRRRGHDPVAPPHSVLDITEPAPVSAAVDAARPDAIVHLAAYTAVDRAESEPEAARALNTDATRQLATLAADRGIPMTLVSTDYVFDGTATAPIPPDTPRSPLGVYGRTKAAAEAALEASGAPYLIVRTSWLYGAGGGNFVDGMLERFGAGQALTIVDDQCGRPTWTGTLARALADLLESGTTGVHHVCDRGEATWYELARTAAELARARADIAPITTAEYPTPAPRPAYSVLELSGTEAALGYELPHWRESLERYLTESGRRT